MAFVCEICSSDNVVKQGGVFVCQDCGTKYSVEDVKKSMNQIPVEDSGSTEKAEHTDRLDNLYILARRAIEMKDAAAAKSHYDAILLEDPDSWEANLHVIYLNLHGQSIDKARVGAERMIKSLDFILEQIRQREHFTDYDRCVHTVLQVCDRLCGETIRRAKDYHHYLYGKVPLDQIVKENEYFTNSIILAARIMYDLGDSIETLFADEYPLFPSKATLAWSCGNGRLADNMAELPGKEYREQAEEWIDHYSARIRTFDSTYEAPEVKTGGCYVATCVYGSYDCPQVWTLRRFRDNTLAQTRLGRSFIRIYYAVSPTFVQWFGHTRWFQDLWRNILDRFVRRLNDRGVDSAPYQDRKW